MRPAMALESIGEEEGRSGEDTERKEKKAEESARSSGRKREGERERERERERALGNNPIKRRTSSN